MLSHVAASQLHVFVCVHRTRDGPRVMKSELEIPFCQKMEAGGPFTEIRHRDGCAPGGPNADP